MSQQAISANNKSDFSGNPIAYIFGDCDSLVERLRDFLRGQSVSVITEKEFFTIPNAEYVFYIGSFTDIKKITQQEKDIDAKVLFIITDNSADEREVTEFLKTNSCWKSIITSEVNVPYLNIEKIFSFFFSQGRKKVLKLKPQSIPAPKKTIEAKLLQSDNLNKKVAGLKSAKSNDSTAKRKQQERKILKAVTDFYTKDNSNQEKPLLANLYLTTGRLVVISIFLASLFVIYPVLSFVGNSTVAFAMLKGARRHFSKSEYKKAQEKLNTSINRLSSADSELSHLSWIFAITKTDSLKQFLKRAISVSKHSANGARGAISAIEAAGTSLGLLTTSGGGRLAASLSEAKEFLYLADSDLAVAEAEGELIMRDYPVLAAMLLPKSYLEGKLALLSDARASLSMGKMLFSLIPELIGFDGKRTYLVLFLNNMEIRPGGGFIGSYGLLSFDQGKMGDLKIEDIYAADGQLKGHVDPPFAIRTFLGQENWYMRDSNWDPDFEESAKQAMWFLEKEVQVSVDGVIALDLSVVERLLDILGPIDLPDYNETISSENLFAKAQNQVEGDFFPGSTQKRDFLGSLGRVLLAKLFENGATVSKTAIFEKLMSSLEEKHLLVYLNSEHAQAMVKSMGLSGSLAQDYCVVESCFSDYLYLVDANLGVNKVNYYISRAITNGIYINRDGTITREVVVLYRNSSQQTQKSGGSYKNYLRIFVPLGSTLSSLKLDEDQVVRAEKEGYKYSKDPVYFLGEEHGRQIVEVFFETPPGSDRRIVASYQLPGRISIDNPDGAFYTLTMQKQPGTDNDMLRTIIEYPAFWQIFDGENQNVAGASTLVKAGRLEYNTRLAQDITAKVHFVK